MGRLIRARRLCLYAGPVVSVAAVGVVAVRPDGWAWAAGLIVSAVVLLAVGWGAFNFDSGRYGVVAEPPSSK
jgi:hypothetical protein